MVVLLSNHVTFTNVRLFYCPVLSASGGKVLNLFWSVLQQRLYTEVCTLSEVENNVFCCLVTQLCLTLCDPMGCSTPGFPVFHHLLELAQTHVQWVSDAFQSSCPLLFLTPRAFNLSQHQGLFQWVGSSHQVVKGLEFQLQHQSFQWIFRADFL